MKLPHDSPCARLMYYLNLRAVAVTILRAMRQGWKHSRRCTVLQWLSQYKRVKALMRDAWTRYKNTLQNLRLKALHADDGKPRITLKQPRNAMPAGGAQFPRLTLRKDLRAVA